MPENEKKEKKQQAIYCFEKKPKKKMKTTGDLLF